MKDHFRTPITKVCEHCKEEFTFVYRRRDRKYCSLKCSGAEMKRLKLLSEEPYREEEKRMWVKYWYYIRHGVKLENIADPTDANNFLYCDRELRETTYKNNKSPEWQL